MPTVQEILEGLKSKVPSIQDKVSELYGKKQKVSTNPFLDGNGNLVNPYINYQAVLDNPGASATVKDFISQATGLSPTVSASQSTESGGTFKPVSAGSVPSGQITPTGGGSSDNAIANAAQKYIGTPYVWGGESMDEGGMDCSGFVYKALNDAGYKVGRTTAQGYRSYGSAVSKAEMQPGDLIFYGKNNDASHIGIYIGNGQMVHSSGGSKNTKDNPGKGVTVSSVDYRSDFIEARRV